MIYCTRMIIAAIIKKERKIRNENFNNNHRIVWQNRLIKNRSYIKNYLCHYLYYY